MKNSLYFYLFFLSSSVLAQGVLIPPGFHAPFWRQDKDIQERMRTKDIIVVSAKTAVVAKDLYELKVVTGGVAQAPFEFTYKLMSQYELLPTADSHFVEVRHDPKKNEIYLHLEALGFHERMTLKIQEILKPKNFQIHWESIAGQFKGMKGVFEVIELERQRTEISMTAEFRASKLPLPPVLMGPGLEFVGKLIAYKLREFAHTKYKE